MVDLARYYTAARLASVGNVELEKVALDSVLDSLEELDTLKKETELRASEFSALGNEVSKQTWQNEFYRLINEIHLLKIDLLAMQMDQFAEDESSLVAAASNLRIEIEQLATKLGGDAATNPRLNLMVAKSLAAVGDFPAAIELLEQDKQRVAGDLLYENRLQAVSLLISQETPEASDQARAILMEQLLTLETMPPELALCILRYNFARASKQTSNRLRADAELDISDSDIAARSMTLDVSISDVLQQKELIGKAFGAYWRLRAEAILLKADLGSSGSQPSGGSAELELVAAQVQQDVIAGRFAEAIQRLQSLETQYLDRDDQQKAFTTARQKNALLYSLLRKQEAVAVTASTARARLNIAERCREVSQRYKALPDADEDALYAMRLAKDVIGKDVELNEAAMKFLYETIKQQLETFPTSERTLEAFHIFEVVSLAKRDPQSLAELWDRLGRILSEKSAAEETIENCRRQRAAFTLLNQLIADQPTKLPVLDIKSDYDRAIQADNALIEQLLMSNYWSDQLIQSIVAPSVAESAGTSSAIAWLREAKKSIADVIRQGTMSTSATNKLPDQPTDVESIVIGALVTSRVAEHYLNANEPCPPALSAQLKNSVDQLRAMQDFRATPSAFSYTC